MKYVFSAIAFAACLCAGTAQAQAYIGANIGTSHGDFDCSGMDSCDDSDTGMKIYGGYKTASGFGVEGFYANLGEAKAESTEFGVPFSAKIESRAIGVAATYTADLGTNFQFAGRLGLASVRTEASVSDGFESVSADETNTAPWIGLSLGYKFTSNVSAQLAWDLTKADFGGETATYNMITLGLRYDF